MSISGQRLLSFISVLALCLTGAMYSGASAQAKNMDASNTKASVHNTKSAQTHVVARNMDEECTPKPDAPPDDPSPDAPVALNDCYRMYPAESGDVIEFLNNDYNPDGSYPPLCGVDAPDSAYGTATPDGYGGLLLTVSSTAPGDFDITYYVCNDVARDSAVITIYVKPMVRISASKTGKRQLTTTVNQNPDPINFSYGNFSRGPISVKTIMPGKKLVFYSRLKIVQYKASVGGNRAPAGKGKVRMYR